MASGKDLYIQAVRGLAISAVVLIHCLPQASASVALRPLLNFSVAAFIFLSGYLTPREKAADAGAFLKRRAGKIVFPYIAWTAIYLAARGALLPATVLASFIVGGGSAQLYYLVVYLQLTLLTPWLFWLLDRPAARVALYAATPLTLGARYALSVAGVSLPVQAFCGSWLLFYLLGLEWRDRVGPWLRGRGIGSRRAFAALLACLALQEAEGFAWLSAGNYDLATTQLKVSSILSSACAVAFIALANDRARSRISSIKPLVRLGDLSFGVYLCHIAVLTVERKVVALIVISGCLQTLLLWIAVLASSALLVLLCQRIFPKKALAVIGFV